MARHAVAVVHVQLVSEAVRRVLAVVQARRRPHLLEHVSLEQLFRVQRRIPLRQIFDRRDHRARSPLLSGTDIGAVLQRAFFPIVAGRAMGNDRLLVIDSRGSHSQRLENALSQEVGIRLAADLLEDHPQKVIAGIAVAERIAGPEGE